MAQKVRFCFVLLKNARGLFFLHEFAFSQQTLVRYCVEGVGRHAAPRRLLLRGASRPGGLQPLTSSRALRGRAVLSPGLLWAAPWASGEASLPWERLEVGRSLAWL